MMKLEIPSYISSLTTVCRSCY